MRLTTVPPTLVAGASTLPAAFERAFGVPTLRRLHGDAVDATPWRKSSRKVDFDMSVSGVPSECRRFFCGDRLRVSTTQTAAVHGEDAISVRVKMRMHFVGSELFIVRPRYRLVPAPGGVGVHLLAEVENHALLPPPLCNVVEAFMDASSRAQLQRLAADVETEGG